MRFALMGLASAFAVLALGVPSSDAQTFFNKRYCVFSGGGLPSGGSEDCSYNTWEQCRASVSGGSCGENPYYAGPTHSAGQPGTNPKRKSQAKRNQ